MEIWKEKKRQFLSVAGKMTDGLLMKDLVKKNFFFNFTRNTEDFQMAYFTFEHACKFVSFWTQNLSIQNNLFKVTLNRMSFSSCVLG